MRRRLIDVLVFANVAVPAFVFDAASVDHAIECHGVHLVRHLDRNVEH